MVSLTRWDIEYGRLIEKLLAFLSMYLVIV